MTLAPIDETADGQKKNDIERSTTLQSWSILISQKGSISLSVGGRDDLIDLTKDEVG